MNLEIALAREVRLRRALQRLLRALLARFYSQETARESKPKPPLSSDDDNDPAERL